MNKKKKLHLKALELIQRYLPQADDPSAHGLGWAGLPCSHTWTGHDPDSAAAHLARRGSLPCHS